MTIDICSRCKKESLLYSKKNKLCMSCYMSIQHHKKVLEGTITEKERQYKKIAFKQWYKKNKERYKLYVKTGYYKHKPKWYVRSRTYLLRESLLIKFNNKCKNCNCVNDLELHHLKYDKNNIEKFIVVLCIKCHRKLHRLSYIDT